MNLTKEEKEYLDEKYGYRATSFGIIEDPNITPSYGTDKGYCVYDYYNYVEVCNEEGNLIETIGSTENICKCQYKRRKDCQYAQECRGIPREGCKHANVMVMTLDSYLEGLREEGIIS